MRKALTRAGCFTLALLLAGAANALRARNVSEPYVAADSPAVDAIYRQEVTEGLFELLVARETLAIAKDAKGEQALDRYLADAAIAALAGKPHAPAGTIAQIVAAPPPPPPAPAIESILATTLRPKLAPIKNGRGHLFKTQFNEHRELAPGLWGTYRQGHLDTVSVLVLIENAGVNVMQFDSDLQIDLGGGKSVRMRCRASPWMQGQLRTGESWLHVCHTDGERVDLPALVAAVRAIPRDATRWKLDPSRINFAQPYVGLSTRGVFWLDGSRARERAIVKLRAVDCTVRASCVEDVKRYLLQQRPEIGFAVIGVGAGLVAGALIAMLTRRWLRWAVFVSLALAGIAIAGILAVAMKQQQGWGILVALAFMLFAGAALAAFVAGLALALVVARLLRRSPVI